MIMKDAKNFDTRAWIVAVGIVLGAFVILSLGICIVLYKEWQEEEEEEDENMPGMKPLQKKSRSAHEVDCLPSIRNILSPVLLLILLICRSFVLPHHLRITLDLISLCMVGKKGRRTTSSGSARCFLKNQFKQSRHESRKVAFILPFLRGWSAVYIQRKCAVLALIRSLICNAKHLC